MRKLVLLTAVFGALVAASQAAVSAAPPGTLTLKATPTAVVYGGSVTLSGVLSTQRTGQGITIEEQTCGTTAFKKAGAATTTTGGNFSTVVKPTINTVYRAREKNTTSPTVSVGVRPLLRLRKVSAGKFSIRLTSATSFVGKFATFQRRTSTGWRTVKRVAFKTVTTTATPLPNTQVSSVTFRVRIKTRLRVRAIVVQSQSTCYLPSTSNLTRS
jgi:hypothetical protein